MPVASERRVAPAAFPVRHVTDVPPQSATAQWLVESLWAASGVGIVGGQPKCLKTWLATELALAVASGGQALGRFAAPTTGRVAAWSPADSDICFIPRQTRSNWAFWFVGTSSSSWRLSSQGRPSTDWTL